MSLKAIHIVFITVSTVLAFGFGWWELRSYSTGGAMLDLVLGGASLGAGIALIAYGRYFLKKLKHIGYL
jgi:DNA-binding transcriptional regulator of glucitol operon